MGFVISVVGALQILAGLLIYAGAATSIHEILGTLFLGLGVLSFALGIAVNHLAGIREALKR